MKIEGEELGKIAKDAIEAEEKHERLHAEQRIKDKVRDLRHQVRSHLKQVKQLTEAVAKAQELADAVQARIDKIKAGDASALEDPKQSPLPEGPWSVPPLWRSNQLLGRRCRASSAATDRDARTHRAPENRT